ncbi:glycosyltransferase family 2 protein [Vibrio sp. Isolate30]|uniref:glycosyltransferase family 2 protein n=1 Tax=Vibrio sp. Isolate30 TaxID=2908536 RepID=UPI001EFEC0D0|nr:glycosyltransferase family 2 protein [Vibrio sp. Isolate30]MCG9632638.1 glycosyltransferase [Vibrio sp. Isolate30]
MSNVEISVTMAAYNCEEFISKAIESVQNQTFKKFEFIIYNDASTDRTLDIIENYALVDKRIIVVNNTQNRGLSYCRNESLKRSKGKFILFLDADDIFHEQLLEKAVTKAKSENSDCVIWDYATFSEESDIESTIKYKKSSLGTISQELKKERLKIPAFTWIKMFNREKLISLNVSFPLGLTYQDVPVHWLVMTKLDNVSILPEILSYYRQQDNAVTHGKGWKRTDYFLVMDIVKEYLINSNVFYEYKDQYLKQRLESMEGVYDVVDNALKPKAKELIKNRIGAEERCYLNSGKELRKRARLFYLQLEGDIKGRILYYFWLKTRNVYRKVFS